MVPRPGSATPEDGVRIKQEPGVDAPSIGRSPTTSEQERPDASWSSEGTFTTGHGASVEPEGYEEQFAVPDVAPHGATPDSGASPSPTGLKPEKPEDQTHPPPRLPSSASKNAGRSYTAEELHYALCKTQLARMLERDPILGFVRPKLIRELTGPIHEPDWKSIADVMMAVHARFRILQEAGFVMGAFEMEKVFDWELASWKDSIRAVTGPLTGLVGMVKHEAQPPRDDRKAVQCPPLPSPYPSSMGSDSSFKSLKQMPMSGRLPRIIQLTAAPERTETPPPEDNAISVQGKSGRPHQGPPQSGHNLAVDISLGVSHCLPLVNDLLEDLDKYLWYCSLDMASGFWVVPMMDRARLISAFITPVGLFEWLRMPFGLCNAPQIYLRLIDNALYGFLRVSPENAAREGGEPERPGTQSAVGRRSYIDDIRIGGESWDDLCRKVERLLGVCEQWHLSISAEKSEWGMPQIDYLGHKVSQHGLQANPKKLESLTQQEKWRHALRAFEILKSKLATTPMLKHFDAEREPVVIVYADGWAIAAVLAQVHGDRSRLEATRVGSCQVNEAEYRGLLLGCSLLQELEVSRLIMCGDSNLAIRQMREEMDCKSPGMKLLRQQARNVLETWPRRELFHVRRDWNASVDMLAGQALQCQAGLDVIDPEEIQSLKTLNRLGEVIRPRTGRPETTDLERPMTPSADAERTTAVVLPVATRAASAHAAAPRSRTPEALQARVVQRLRLDHIRTDQDEERWIANLKKYLRGELGSLSKREAKDCWKIAPQYEGRERAALLSYSGRRVCRRSRRGAQVGLDLFTGFVIAKANASRSAQTVVEAYEEAVFRRFRAGEAIQHDREPGFMADFFKAFNKRMGQRQRATLAYHPQANGAGERMVQTVTRAVKMYIADVDQRDWDEYAERLTFALNTAHGRTRDETPFYLVHGWDARSTLEATLSIGNTSRRDADARRWRMRIQRYYKIARAQALELVQEAVAERARRHNEGASQHSIEMASRVWLYLDRVKPGYARKLAHMWHGPSRVAERVNTFAVRLETARTPYQLFPVVHISKLKPVREFPTRPETRLTVPADGRFDFEEELLPEDSWNAHNVEDDVFEVEKIMDVREGRATRYGRTRREFEVKWKGYPDSPWDEEADKLWRLVVRLLTTTHEMQPVRGDAIA
ncbi:unnamed protein product [Phytophthora fragariaefolia]|uniref:Unnamed protein product n=1 Tax=Phytophthora fragariaefolia TaxID=1490495 RepID=A0A9W6Y3B6_9STRA|nr:unnamed protein product [Phytophthora fragariaefolia]